MSGVRLQRTTIRKEEKERPSIDGLEELEKVGKKGERVDWNDGRQEMVR